jgi:hypothetical protein
VGNVRNISKYYPLEKYLYGQESNRIRLTYTDIEKIIGDRLPPSAYEYHAWWANGGHSQADAWLNAGWRVDQLDLGKSVVFIKEKGANNRNLKIGRKYRHFKGREYLVLHIAKHSETLEELVVYQALYGDMEIWARPLDMFLDQVEVNGALVNRFEESRE